MDFEAVLRRLEDSLRSLSNDLLSDLRGLILLFEDRDRPFRDVDRRFML